MIKVTASCTFGLMAIVNVFAAWDATGMETARRLLMALLWTLLVLMTMRRSKSRGRDRSPLAVVTALASTVVTFPIGLAVPTSNQVRLTLAYILVISGLAFSVYAIANLGRCFGILADARGLVTKGAYQFVRHPLYLGELTCILGVALAADEVVIPMLFWAALTTIQLVRMHYEERILAATFPEYTDYAAQVPHRLVPGLY